MATSDEHIFPTIPSDKEIYYNKEDCYLLGWEEVNCKINKKIS